jgi:hypothetical protein
MALFVLHRRPMCDKLFETMVPPCAEHQAQTDCLPHPQRALNPRLEVATQRVGVVGQEAEHIDANDLAAAGLAGVEHLDHAGRVEGNELRIPVDDEELIAHDRSRQRVIFIFLGTIWLRGAGNGMEWRGGCYGTFE